MILRLCILLAFCLGLSVSGQRRLPIDSTGLAGASSILADDYGAVYVFQNKDFSLSKYDSLGVRAGRVMLPVPFRVLGVQNPLNIVLFSQNAQQLRFLDQNLNEKQRVAIPADFGFVSAVYTEDPAQAWLLDTGLGRLVRYDFRNAAILNNYPVSAASEGLLDMLVYGGSVFLLYGERLLVLNLNGGKIADLPITNAKRLRRENERIYIICQKNILRYLPTGSVETVFEAPDADFVDKNTAAFFAVGANKLYLYRPAKVQK